MTTNTTETSQVENLLRQRVEIQKGRIADLKRALLECASTLECTGRDAERFVKMAEEI